MGDINPVLDYDRNTHRYWWTWIPAHPTSRDDRWYQVLEWVFADNTINWRSKTKAWRGYYTEHSEYHQTVGVFHTFSALPTLRWIETLLRASSIEFVPPVTAVRWQYELKGKLVDGRGEGNADIALRVTDANGPEAEFAVVIEAKCKGGSLKPQEAADPDHYLQLSHLSSFKRKFVVYLLDESDRHSKLVDCSVVTWQTIGKMQMDELERLALPTVVKSRLMALMRRHLGWYKILDYDWREFKLEDSLSEDDMAVVDDPRIAALIRGAEVVARARARRPICPPAEWLKDEHTIEDFAKLKKFKGTDWYRAIW